VILYFSATGNSQYVAHRLAEALSEKALSIESAPRFLDLTGESALGLAVPTYAWGLPSVAAAFFRQASFILPSDLYLYAVATCGSSPGHVGHFADKLLRERTGRCFDAFFRVRMPDTWTPLFDLSDSRKVAAQNQRAEAEIDAVIKGVQNRTRVPRMKGAPPPFTRFLPPLLYEHIRKTKNFTVRENCLSCGRCARSCPDGAIEIRGGKPRWIKGKCAMCLRCLHLCPVFSIQYGKKTKKHGQYRHPLSTFGKT
jgi:ferredoxin